MITTVSLNDETKKALQELKVHPRESYNDLLKRLISKIKNEQSERIQTSGMD